MIHRSLTLNNLNGSEIHATFPISQSWPLPIVHETCKRRWPLHQLLLQKSYPCWILLYIINSAFRTSPETVPLLTKQFLLTLWFNEFSRKFWAKLINLLSTLDSHMQIHTLESGSYTYQVKFVCAVAHQWDLSWILIEVLCTIILSGITVGWESS